MIINGIPSKCSTNCSFQFSDNKTPTVNSIKITNQTSVTLIGAGFDGKNTTNNQVYIGTTKCSITSANSTLLICSPGNNSEIFFLIFIYLRFI